MTKVRCKDLPDSDWGDFRCRRAVDSSSLIGGVRDFPVIMNKKNDKCHPKYILSDSSGKISKDIHKIAYELNENQVNI